MKNRRNHGLGTSAPESSSLPLDSRASKGLNKGNNVPCQTISPRIYLVVVLISFTLFVVSRQLESSSQTTVKRKRHSYEAGFGPPPLEGIRRPRGETTAGHDDATKRKNTVSKDGSGQTKDKSTDIESGTARRKKHSARIISLNYNEHNELESTSLSLEKPHTNVLVRHALPWLDQNHGVVQPHWYLPNAIEQLDWPDTDTCEPMFDWQLRSFQNCNKFHEVDWFGLSLINGGGSRIAFQMDEILGGSTTKFVYKTMKYKKDIDDHHIEQQRKDALIMERTSSSMFIPNIHGYCSLAVMMDFMPEGNLHDYIKGARIAGGSTLAPVDKLRISIHLASSVAALHGIDGSKIPPYFHNDICCHQFLFQDGIFKLNDFNYARPMLVKKDTGKQCTRDRFHMVMWKGRSLEEHQRSLHHPDFTPLKPDKLDVWMLGNVIYIILTDLYLFEKPKNLSGEESGRKMVMGKRSPYPDNIASSNDPSYVAIKKALDMCWEQNWRERPSAREVADYLMKQLRTITEEENPDLRVILPERSKNQRPTDSEFEHFND